MNILKGNTIHFDDRYLHVELKDGRIISTPIQWYPALQKATIEQLRNYQFICRGTGIEWSELDYHLSIEAMLLGKTKKTLLKILSFILLFSSRLNCNERFCLH